MKDIIQKLLAAFDVEHREHLVKIRAYLAALEAGTQGPGSVDINEAFRCAHSLKGASRVVDLKTITELAHRLEALFAQIQTGKRSPGPDYFSTITRVLDMIEDTVAASRAGQPIPDHLPLNKALDDLLEGKAVLAQAPAPAPQPMTAKDFNAAVPAPEAAPTPAPAEAPEVFPIFKQPVRAGASFDTMRLSAEHFDRLIKTAGEVISFSRNQEANAGRLKEMNHLVRNLEKEWGIVQKHSSGYLREISNDADKNRLVKYLNFMESQIRVMSRQLRAVTADQRNDNFSLRLLGEQLQEDVQTARLMPASDVFESFSKMMRDLAKDESKEVDFKMLGMDIEADRVVLQALKDPLMHILRNALSHGIEAPSEREAKRKPRSGKISLHLEVAARRLNLTISDDGKGIQLDRIREKALEAGLVSTTELDTLSPEDIRALIFHPGFSTASSVTEISGRGVGLSVVKDAVERLQGEIVIDSQSGIDCQFKISVPLSLSTHRLILMESQGQIFAIPTHAVQRVQRAKSQDLLSIEGRLTLKVNGLNVPIMALSQLLGMKDASVKPSEDALAFAVLKMGEKRLAVAVDRLLGEREGLIKDLGSPLSRSGRFAGALLLDRASIVLVLNPPALFEAYHQLRHGQPLQITQRTAEKQKLRILVVDDSFTTRILEKSILEAKGYLVSVATDGLEALTFLKSHEVDLIISDVEMPRMDGLTLLQNVRANPKLAKLPVIMVSSKDQREDQERGLQLGADAYLPKQEFNQKILLDTIRQVI